MLEVVCDNSDLTAIWGAEAPDVVILGGYALEVSALRHVVARVRQLKAAYGFDPDCPVKWNLKDRGLRLERHGLEACRNELLAASDDLRAALLGALLEQEPAIFLSMIVAHSNRREVIGKTKRDLVSYSFSNLLMRLGLYCKSRNGDDEVQLLLDWPEANAREPFVDAYVAGWRRGESGPSGAPTSYFSGPLRELRFRPGLSFSILDLEPRLQLADLVVGAGRSFVDHALQRAPQDSFGVRQFCALLPHLYQDGSGRVFGYGISVSPTSTSLAEAVKHALAALQRR